MCPPAASPLPDISEYCSAEQLSMLLKKFVCGGPLPTNVTSDVNPHHYKPQYLPAGLWYFIDLQNHRAMEHGTWKAIGGPCKIFSNDSICGWMTTYQFHDQQSSNNSSRNWRMEEYTITQNGIDDRTIGKDSRALCRVFQRCHALPGTSLGTPGDSTHLLNLNSITREGESSTRNCQANNIEAEPIVARGNPLNRENVPDADREDFQGDYLEIDDLVPQSPSSSSGNSSCLTVSSNECFDSLRLQDIENDIIQDSEKKGADHKFNVASVIPDRIITCALSPGSSTARRQEEIQTTGTTIASSPHSSATTGKTAGQTLPKQEIIEELQNPDDIPAARSRATSTLSSVARASTGESTAERRTKGRWGMKMLEKLCFMP